MISYLGNFAEDATVYIMFNTFTSNDPSASSTITNFINTDVHIHKDDGLAQRNNAAGITVSVDFDGITGSHMVKIDTSDDTVAGFWVIGHEYFVRIEGTTIDGATINSVIGQFSIENRFKEVTVTSIAANAITAASINADAITEAKIADNAIAGEHLNATACTKIIDDFETQSQADPTGFHVNVLEIGGTAQTANDNGADINDILTDTNELQTDWVNDGRLDLILDIIAQDTTTDIPGTITTMQGNVTDILGDTNELQGDWANAGRLDTILDACALEATVAALNNISAANVETSCDASLVTMFTSSAQLVDDVWDEVLSGATHNIATSAGRRVRELGAYFITGGTAQAGAAHSITLAAGESATSHIFNRNLLVLLAGTGAGQTRTIVDYDGATKIAVVDRDWWVNPDATSEYSIIPDDTPLVADHGVAQAGAATTITLRAAASAINSTYADIIIFIMAGTGAGQTRLIDSYVGATKVATIHGTWTTNPDATSVYAMIAGGQSHVEDITAAALAKIKTQSTDALTDIKLDHLLAVADGDDPVDNSVIAMLAASDGDWSGFAIADDSLEAIRDRGDAAWITGAGGSPATTLQNTTINVLASQTEFTIVAGSADDDAYNGCIVVVEDSVTATQKCVGRILNYTGATKTVFLEADPGVFVMANGDTVDIIAVELTWEAATKALTDKAGFALSAAGIDAFLDEVIGDAVHATPNSVGAMLHAVYCRFMQKRTATATVEKSYKLDDITELKAFTLAHDGTTASRT